MPGVGRALEVELDEHQFAHHRPATGGEAVVRVAHALRDRACRVAGLHAQATAAQQRGGERELHRCGQLGRTLSPGDHALAHAHRQRQLAQLAFVAEADDDHALRARQPPRVARVAARVDEDLLCARHFGIETRRQAGVHRAADQVVDGLLGAGQRQRAVVTDHQRVADEAQVAVQHRHAQRGALGRVGRLDQRAPARLEDRAHAVRRHRQHPCARRPAAHHHRPCGAARRVGRRQARQAVGVAAREQLVEGRVGRRRIGQSAVFAVQRPGAHAGQQGQIEGHAAVAAVGGVQVDQAFVAELETVGRELRVTDDEQQLVGEGRQRLSGLRVQALAQRLRLVEHALRWHAPFVGRTGVFVAGLAMRVGMPPVVLLHALQIVVGQALPGLAAVERLRRVEQVGLQLQEAGHRGHDLARLAVLQWGAERDQRVAEGVVAREHLHRRPRAAVGRAQHQQPRAFARHQALPGRGPLELHRARDQPTHRMRDQAHRLAAGVARGERGVHRVGEPARLVLDRAAPVEGERDHLVALRQVVDEVVVDHADRAVGRDVVGLAAGVGEPAQAADQAQAEPDALVAGLQVAAQDAGQHEHRRLRARRPAVVDAAARGAQAAGILAGPGQRADRAKAARLVLRQAADHRVDGALVREVVEVGDLAALVEQEAGAGRARRAAVHRARLHDDVVVGPVEGVGEQRLQPAADRIALQVAGDHAQLAGDRLVDAVQPLHERAVRDHRGQPGQDGRIGAPACDLGQEVQQLGQHRQAGEFERPLQHRQVGVQPLRREQRAARRAGDAHDAVDVDVALAGSRPPAPAARHAARRRRRRRRTRGRRHRPGVARRAGPALRRPGRRANASPGAAARRRAAPARA